MELAALFLGEAEQGGFGDLDHVLAAVAQGRHVDRHDVEAVVEVLAEMAAADGVERVAVGGADDADVDLARAGRTHGLDGGGLQEAQKLGLQGRGHLADLVQKERAAIGSGCGPGLVGNRAGEAALHVAEDLGFQQVLRDRAAVQRDEGAVGAGGIGVDGQARKVLSRCRFRR